MKDIVKLVVSHFFIITVSVLFFTSLSTLLGGNGGYPPAYPWMVMLAGIVGSIPSLLFYFKNEPTKRQFAVRVIIHFILVASSIMSMGALFGWYEDFLQALLLFVMFLAIYVFVWFYSYRMYLTDANNINSALEEFNREENE